MYLRSKLKLQREECLSTEDSEIEPSSERSVGTQGVSEGVKGGLNTMTSGLVMGALNHGGDRVAMARASRSQEEEFAKTACISFNYLKVSFSYSRPWRECLY